jgi:DNA-directed RNA polymerase specialized sigma subunit
VAERGSADRTGPDRGMAGRRLVQRGNDGLLFALKTFPDHPNQSFSAYAAACVETAIAKAIADSKPLTE